MRQVTVNSTMLKKYLNRFGEALKCTKCGCLPKIGDNLGRTARRNYYCATCLRIMEQ